MRVARMMLDVVMLKPHKHQRYPTWKEAQQPMEPSQMHAGEIHRRKPMSIEQEAGESQEGESNKESQETVFLLGRRFVSVKQATRQVSPR